MIPNMFRNAGVAGVAFMLSAAASAHGAHIDQS
jgi:hypothetical protein